MSTNEPPQYPDHGSTPGWGAPGQGQQGQGQQGGYGPPPPPPPQAPGGYGYGYGYPQPQQSQKAMWSMIIGIVSVAVCCLAPAGIASIIMGHQAKREIAQSQGAVTGHGQAQAGFVLGIIGAVISVGWIAYFVLIFAVAGAGEF